MSWEELGGAGRSQESLGGAGSPGRIWETLGGTGRSWKSLGGARRSWESHPEVLLSTGPAAYMLPMVMGPHTVGKVSQPSFSIKGRSKLGSFSDDLHKARTAPPVTDQRPLPESLSLLGVSALGRGR